jgi:hypothetical protein
MIVSKQAADDRRVEILQISEADFRSLPKSIRMLLLAYSKSAPSGQDGLIVLEMHAYRWPEIDSEIRSVVARVGTTQEPKRFKRTVRYANDYECPNDGAAWSRVGCASARRERCPVCHGKVKPTAGERYVIVQWVPVLPSLWSRLKGLLPIS